MAKTYLQVQKQIQQLQKEAAALRDKEAAGVLSRIKEAIAVYGFTADDLGVGSRNATPPTVLSSNRPSVKPRKKANGSPATPKYKDDQGNIWGGRGPRPGWFKAAIESGKTPADLAA
jgi:DNA-binding protein H-NS